MAIGKEFLVGVQIRNVGVLFNYSNFYLKNPINNTSTDWSHLYNCINSVYEVDNHSIFSRITCIHAVEYHWKYKGKMSFCELKSCYPMTN